MKRRQIPRHHGAMPLILAELKRGGSHDPDVLYARKREMIADARAARRRGAALVALGAALTLSLVGALAGIPALLDGWRRFQCGSRDVEAIEAAFLEFTSHNARRHTSALARSEIHV